MIRAHALLVIFIATISTCYASWSDSFPDIYRTHGIDEAVVHALAEGASPNQIIRAALPLEDLKREVLIKALFCALAEPETIHEAARINSISEPTVEAGYQLALAECPRQMEENLNSALIRQSGTPGLAPANSNRSTNYASPWKFE